MRPINVLFVGFGGMPLPNDAPNNANFIMLDTQNLNPKEVLLRANVRNIDVVVVSTYTIKYSAEEVVTMYSAYTNATPIFALGRHAVAPIVEAMITRRFESFYEFTDHLIVNYIKQPGRN